MFRAFFGSISVVILFVRFINSTGQKQIDLVEEAGLGELILPPNPEYPGNIAVR